MEAASSWGKFIGLGISHVFSTAPSTQQPSICTEQSPLTRTPEENQTEATALEIASRTLVFFLNKHRDDLFDVILQHPMTTKQMKPTTNKLDAIKKQIRAAYSVLDSNTSSLPAGLFDIGVILVQVKAALQAVHNSLDVLESKNTYYSKRLGVALAQLRRKESRHILVQEIAADLKLAYLWNLLDITLSMILLSGTMAKPGPPKEDDRRVHEQHPAEEAACFLCLRGLNECTAGNAAASPTGRCILSPCCQQLFHSNWVRGIIGEQGSRCPKCMREWEDETKVSLLKALINEVGWSMTGLELDMEHRHGPVSHSGAMSGAAEATAVV